MDRFYQEFLRSGIGLGPLGLEGGGVEYFCTPRGASIIGSEGVDGVHYCFVRGYGGAVFAVSPLKPEPERVQPVAPCAGSRFLRNPGRGAQNRAAFRRMQPPVDKLQARFG